MTTPSKGFLLVASKEYRYYAWACNLADGIKDFYPEAQICIVTEERFADERLKVADDVIWCDDNYRAKLWGMARTPYDLTFYIDADMEVINYGIEEVFDELGDADMMFTGLPEDRYYIFNDDPFPGGRFELCGACCLYRKTDKVIGFMHDWYHLYQEHAIKRSWWPTNEQGEPDYENYPERLRKWDQFSLFWLTQHEPRYADLKVEIFENDLRWNYWAILDRVRTPMPENTVLLHLSCAADKNV